MANERSLDRDSLRDAFLDSYHGLSPYLHLICTVGTSLAVGFMACSMVRAMSWIEALTIPTALMVANFVEWCVHRNAMHRPVSFMHSTYEMHTKVHHVLYVSRAMAMRDAREWGFVLMPAKNLAALAVIAAAAWSAADLVFGTNVAWLTLATLSGYVAVYELLHLAYHLPESHPIGRYSIIRRLARHHTIHHDPGLMGKWHMNITIPLADWCLGTIAPSELVRQRTAMSVHKTD